MSHSCPQWRGDIGACIVGALDGAARDRVIRHLAACAGCRADYDELIPVRGWLTLLALTTEGPEPGPAGQPGRPWWHNSLRQDPLPESASREDDLPAAGSGGALMPRPRLRSGAQLPAPPGGKRPAIRPGTSKWLAAAGVVLAAASAVAVLVSSGAPARTFRALDSATGVTAYAQLKDTPTGTQINLTASGLPRNERCILVAVTRAGSDIAGSWAATYYGSARIAGTTAIHANQLTALRIESDTGVLLLSIRV